MRRYEGRGAKGEGSSFLACVLRPNWTTSHFVFPTSNLQLTVKQRQVLEFVLSFRERNGRTPSGPEIAEHFGYRDASPAYQHLELIARKGYVEIRQSGKRRPLEITLTERGEQLFEQAWPHFGTIPAGPVSTVLAEDADRIRGVEDLLPMIRQGDYFLTVEGDSMIEAGLEEGMTVLVRPTADIREGAICAVWVEGEGGTLKRVYHEGETIRLVPENARYAEKRHPADQVRIQGVVVAAMELKTNFDGRSPN